MDFVDVSLRKQFCERDSVELLSSDYHRWWINCECPCASCTCALYQKRQNAFFFPFAFFYKKLVVGVFLWNLDQVMFFVQKIHHVLMSCVSSPTVAVGTSIQRGHDNPACCKTNTKAKIKAETKAKTKAKIDRYDCLKSGDELAACSQLFWRRRKFPTFVSSLFFSSRPFTINNFISSFLFSSIANSM